MSDYAGEFEGKGEDCYVGAVKHKNGNWMFFRGSTASDSLADHPGRAAQFDVHSPKEKILEFLDAQLRRQKPGTVIADSLTLIRYRTSLEAVNVDTHEWRVELQRHGVSKLSPMEIKALRLESVEMERRLAQPPQE